MLFAEYFHKYTFYCRNTISFRFARINICCFRPAFLDCIKVDSRRFSAIQKPSLIIEPGFPAHIIEIFQDTIPFAMGIIAQAAFVGRQSVTPSRNLYTGIPLVQFLFFRSTSTISLLRETLFSIRTCSQQSRAMPREPRKGDRLIYVS